MCPSYCFPIKKVGGSQDIKVDKLNGQLKEKVGQCQLQIKEVSFILFSIGKAGRQYFPPILALPAINQDIKVDKLNSELMENVSHCQVQIVEEGSCDLDPNGECSVSFEIVSAFEWGFSFFAACLQQA